MFKPLRDKILELAITGKLVPQMDSEPAVEQIGPAPAKEEEPFALPEKWKWVRLEYLSLASFSGGTPSKDKSDYWNGSIPWASIKDLSVDSEELSATKDHITAKGLANSSTKLVEANNVIVGMRMGLNKVVINTIPLAINQDLRAFYLDCSLIAPKFFVKFYRTLKFEGAGTTVKGIRKDELMGMFVPLPPLEEQRRIVSKLDDIMGNLERMDQAYTELSGPMAKHFKNLVLQQAISGQLVPQLDSEPAVEQIGLAPASYLGSWRNGANPSRTNSSYWENGSINWLQTAEINDCFVTSVKERITIQAVKDKNLRLNPVGSVLVAMCGNGGAGKKLGILGVPSTTNSACCSCIVNQNLVFNWFLFYVLLSFRAELVHMAGGSTQKNLSKEKLVKLWIPLPPLEEQRRIVARIEELFGDVDKLLEWQQFA